VALGNLPVLDADRPAQDRMLVQRDVAADIDILSRAQSLVDSNTATFEGQAKRLGEVEVRLDADRDQHKVDVLIGPVGDRHAGYAIALGVPAIDSRARADVDASIAVDARVNLADFSAKRSLQRHRQRLDDQNILAERSEEHTSELQSRFDLVCRLLLEKK